MTDRWRWWGFRLNSALLHRLARRFTPAGRLALCALAASAIWGVDTTQSMAFQSFTLLLALLLAAVLGSLRRPGPLAVRRILPRFGTAGETLAYRIVVENRTDRPQRGLGLLEEFPDPRPSLEEFAAVENPDDSRPLWKDMRPFWLDRLVGYTRWRTLVDRRRLAEAGEASVPDLPPRARAEVSVRLLPRRRGRLTFSGLTFSRPEPLGLAAAARPVPLPQSVLILPKRYPAPRLSLPGSRRYQQGGVALASSVGNSQEYMGLRDYRAGDPPRRIHWRSWAKAGRPVVKEFEDEYFSRHALVLDTFAAHGQEGAFEEAVSVAASFACSVLTQESLLDLLFVGGRAYCFTAGRGLGGADRLLEVLACLEARGDGRFSDLHASVAGRAAALSGAVLVLLGLDEPRKKLVGHLRGLGLPTRVFVVTEHPDGVEAGAETHVLEPGRIAEGLAKARP